ncbi:MAG: hypothetical protein HGB00_10370 [Chlorobiaceae bacterium]|nr:hypothetical protein [Chlorobiaceae bacterium]
MSQDVTSMHAEITGGKIELDRLIAIGWNMYRRNFRSILPVVLMIAIPLDLIRTLIPASETAMSASARGMGPFTTFSVVMDILFRSISFMALFRLIESSLDGNPMPWPEAFRHSLSRWAPSVVTSLLASLIVMGMTLLLIVPGIMWAFYYSFLLMAVSLRGLSGKAALDLSKGLVKGQWWRVFGFHVVFVLFYVVFISAIQPVMILLPNVLVVQVATKIVYDLFFAYSQTMAVLFFLNTEATKHGAGQTPDYSVP